MFSRGAIKQTAWAMLLAVVFVVLLPAILNAAGLSTTTNLLSVASSICTLDGEKAANHALPDTPDQTPVPVAHQPCVFCTSSVPVFADANAPRLTAFVEGMPVFVGKLDDPVPPRNVAAMQPLSPRAPPR